MPNYYIQSYIPILMLLAVVILLAVGMLVVSYLLGQHRPTREKLAAYECGITPTGDARHRFSVKFYLVAMVFILFDVEVIFLYPWAVVFKELGIFGFVEMLFFLLIVLAGFAYLWKKGALDWTKADSGDL